MRWQAKAALQKGLSTIPKGEAANYWLQRRVTRNLPRGERSFDQHVDCALSHLEVFSRFGKVPPGEATFYEFGAGWDLVGPLTYWACGIERQVLVDIRPNLRPELVEDTLRRLGDALARHGVERRREIAPVRIQTASDLARFGIEYLAPRDARATGLPDESLDFVSSSFTMEHIPPTDLVAILIESRRLLRAGAPISSAIDFVDHYSYADSSIGPHNFLRYPDRTWRLVNSDLHYQNRLRLPDYRRLFVDADLRIIEERVVEALPADREGAARMPLAPRFENRYSIDDLTALGALFVGVR